MSTPTDAGTKRLPLTRVIETKSRGFASSILHGSPLCRDPRGALFAPGQVFIQRAILGPPGTRGRFTVTVARAAAPGRRVVRLPGVTPGAELLLRAATKDACWRAVAAFRRLAKEGIDPAGASPAWFRDLHVRLAARMEPRPYTRARHAAHLALERTGGWTPRAPAP